MPRCRKTVVLSLQLHLHAVFAGLYLDQLRVELDRLGSVGNGISVCFCLDVCLEMKLQPVSYMFPRAGQDGLSRTWALLVKNVGSVASAWMALS